MLVDLVEQLHNKGDSEFVEGLTRLNLSFAQMRLLMVLSRHEEPVPINELAEGARLSVASAGRNVDALVTLGLVDRREDPSDRRVKRVSLSAAGVALDTKHHEAMRAQVAALVQDLPIDQVERLRDALGPIVERGHEPGGGK